MQSQIPASSDSEPRSKRKPILHFWRCFWLSFLVISLAYAWHCFYVPANSITWAKSYTTAQSQAVESGKPLILYFTGEWCVPCRVMKRKVWADEQVTLSVNSNFIPVLIDVDNPEYAAVLARYDVAGAPVTIVTDPHGNALRWRAGSIGKFEFLEFLNESNPLIAGNM